MNTPDLPRFRDLKIDPDREVFSRYIKARDESRRARERRALTRHALGWLSLGLGLGVLLGRVL